MTSLYQFVVIHPLGNAVLGADVVTPEYTSRSMGYVPEFPYAE